jgi:hypothetical protein
MAHNDQILETRAENHWISIGNGSYRIPVTSGIAVYENGLSATHNPVQVTNLAPDLL